MTSQPLVSILINNHNYGRFLPAAIDSALSQTYPRVEVIVVNDGSTDDSRRIIAAYADPVIAVLKENGGQASALTAGFTAAHGDVICLLDADDRFWQTKVETVVRFLSERDLLGEDVLVFHDVRYIDAGGQTVPTPRRLTRRASGENYYALARTHGYALYPSYQPSGAALTRSLAARIFPLPEGFPSGGDSYLIKAAGLLGRSYGLESVLADYRVHGANHWFGTGRMKPRAFYAVESEFLNTRLVENGLPPAVRTLDPWHLRGYFLEECRPLELVKLAILTPSHHADLKRWKFSPKTFLLAARVAARRACLRLAAGGQHV